MICYTLRRSIRLIGVGCALFMFTGCLDNELYKRGLSRDLSDTPKIVGLLQNLGVMDEDGGMIQVYIYNSQGIRLRMDAQPLQYGGKQIDYWSWRKTQAFYLSPDKFRDKVNSVARDYPPDSYLTPGSLGRFLASVYEATQ